MIKENKVFILMLIGILILFFLATFLLGKSQTSPSYFAKLTSFATKYINPDSEALIPDNTKYEFTLKTDKGDVSFELDPSLGYYNVQNVYKISKAKGFDGIIISTVNQDTFNILSDTSKSSLKVYQEVNFNSLKLTDSERENILSKKIFNDDSYQSRRVQKGDFLVKIDGGEKNRNSFWIVLGEPSLSSGEYLPLGKIKMGEELLKNNTNLKINSSTFIAKQ